MASRGTPDTSRDARPEARVSAAHERLLRHAAAHSGRRLSDSVIAMARHAARRVMVGHESARVSWEEQRAFVQALLNPPVPNPRVERAVKAYRQRTGA